MVSPYQPLNPMQTRFVEEMLEDPTSPTAAAKRAGYALKHASHAASGLMKDVRVQETLKKAQDKRAERIGISKERVLQELALIAFAKVGGLVRVVDGVEQVNVGGLNDINSDFPIEATVSTTKGSIKTQTITYRTVKLADKIAALEKLGKHLGMFKDQVEVNGTISLEKLVEASMIEAPGEIIEGEVIEPLLENQS